MALKLLPLIDYNVKDEKEIERMILNYLYYILFYPLIETNKLAKKAIENANNILEEAIKAGKIYYEDGRFKGKFNASLSKELQGLGAEYLKKSKAFSLPENKIPFNLRQAIYDFTRNNDNRLRDTLNVIGKIDLADSVLPNFILPYSGIINDLDIEVAKNTKGFAVIPDLSKLMKDNIAKTYSHNLNLYIKNFSQEEVFKLRREVEKNLYTGFRREQLVELIKDRYAVTQRKAKFLAKQETNLLLSEFTAERYKDAGIKKFQWTKSSSKVPDEYHKTLYGKVFSFDDLPVIDEKIGQKGLPRQRYNCSCGMRAVLETND